VGDGWPQPSPTTLYARCSTFFRSSSWSPRSSPMRPSTAREIREGCENGPAGTRERRERNGVKHDSGGQDDFGGGA
jgi:hypothetical protein